MGTRLRKEVCPGHAWKAAKWQNKTLNTHVCSIFLKHHNGRKQEQKRKRFRVNQESKGAGKHFLGGKMKTRLFRELQRQQSWDPSCGRNQFGACRTTLTLHRPTSFQWRGRILAVLLRRTIKPCGTHGSLHVSWRSLEKGTSCYLELLTSMSTMKGKCGIWLRDSQWRQEDKSARE